MNEKSFTVRDFCFFQSVLFYFILFYYYFLLGNFVID